jgi:transposase
VAGVVGRTSGRAYLGVISRAGRANLGRGVEDTTAPGRTVYTDEWRAYARLEELGRRQAAVCPTPGKRAWARGDDGDGVREAHDNTLEGRWAGPRNFLRMFRGISKHDLGQGVAIFQWVSNCPDVCWDFVQAVLFTNFAP